MAACGVRAIVWSGGGEPTLHPAFSTIVQTASRFGLEQGVYTLGGHVTEAMAATVGPLLSWVVVSLDAPDAATYAAEKHVPASRFDEACEGVRRLTRSCPVVGVSFLVHEGNYTRVQEMLALSRSLGATYATFRPTVQTSPDQPGVVTADRWWIQPALHQLRTLARESDVEVDPQRFETYRQWTGHGYQTCHGISLLTMVTPDGRLWVCPNKRGVPSAALGDLREESFAAIWARHPGHVPVDRDCRALCRLHLVNQTLSTVFQPRAHEAFV
jgi:MoaA/NifB/PqqE/SkfB family radical SAM enzyme